MKKRVAPAGFEPVHKECNFLPIFWRHSMELRSRQMLMDNNSIIKRL